MTQLALVIDLNVCVGCHACVTPCKEWNTSGSAGPIGDQNPSRADPPGTFFHRALGGGKANPCAGRGSHDNGFAFQQTARLRIAW